MRGQRLEASLVPPRASHRPAWGGVPRLCLPEPCCPTTRPCFLPLLPRTKVTPSPGKSGSPSKLFLPGAVSGTLFTQFPPRLWVGGGRGGSREGSRLGGARVPEDTELTQPEATELHPELTFVLLGGGGRGSKRREQRWGTPGWGCRERLEDETEEGRESRSEFPGGSRRAPCRL